MKSILTEQQLAITIKRLAHQVLENHINLENTVLIGIQPRGVFLSDKIAEEIKKELQERDERDKKRKISPLIKTADS